jgi:hypothetical protein
MKHLKKLLIILLLILLSIASVSAEEGNTFESFDESLGGSFSTLSGIGLSYQRWFGNIGVQTAVGLIYVPDDIYYLQSADSPDSVESSLFFYNIGVGLQYMLIKDSYEDWFEGCLYLVTGITHFADIKEMYNYSDTADEYLRYPFEDKSGSRFVPGFSTGIGIGIEFVFFNHFSIPVELALNGSWDIDSWIPFEAGVKVLGGLRYRF